MKEFHTGNPVFWLQLARAQGDIPVLGRPFIRRSPIEPFVRADLIVTLLYHRPVDKGGWRRKNSSPPLFLWSCHHLVGGEKKREKTEKYFSSKTKEPVLYPDLKSIERFLLLLRLSLVTTPTHVSKGSSCPYLSLSTLFTEFGGSASTFGSIP